MKKLILLFFICNICLAEGLIDNLNSGMFLPGGGVQSETNNKKDNPTIANNTSNNFSPTKSQENNNNYHVNSKPIETIINPNPPLPPLDPMNSNNNQSSSDDNRAGRFASGSLIPLIGTAAGGAIGKVFSAPIPFALIGEGIAQGVANVYAPEIEEYGQKAWNATKDIYNTFIEKSIQADNYCKQSYPTPASLCEDPASYKFGWRIK